MFSVLFLKATEQAKEEMKKVLAYLNQHLNTRTFLVGERVSLADITVVCSLLWLYKQVRHRRVGIYVICLLLWLRSQAKRWINVALCRFWTLLSVSPTPM